jgi:hypothetical protein
MLKHCNIILLVRNSNKKRSCNAVATDTLPYFFTVNAQIHKCTCGNELCTNAHITIRILLNFSGRFVPLKGSSAVNRKIHAVKHLLIQSSLSLSS